MHDVLLAIIAVSGGLAVLTQQALGWRAHRRSLMLLTRTAPRDDLVAALFIVAMTLIVFGSVLLLITTCFRLGAWTVAYGLFVSSHIVFTTTLVAGVFAGWPLVGRVQVSILTLYVSSNVVYVSMLLLNALTILRAAG